MDNFRNTSSVCVRTRQNGQEFDSFSSSSPTSARKMPQAYSKRKKTGFIKSFPDVGWGLQLVQERLSAKISHQGYLKNACKLAEPNEIIVYIKVIKLLHAAAIGRREEPKNYKPPSFANLSFNLLPLQQQQLFQCGLGKIDASSSVSGMT